MSPIKQFNKLPTYAKVAAGILTFLITFTGAVIAIDERYVDQVEIVSSLQQYDQKVQQQIQGQALQFKMWELEQMTDQYYQLKRLQRMYPDDAEITDELEAVKERRDKLKEELRPE